MIVKNVTIPGTVSIDDLRKQITHVHMMLEKVDFKDDLLSGVLNLLEAVLDSALDQASE